MIDWDPAHMAYEPGIILSPGYELGEPYPQNSYCEWKITSGIGEVRVYNIFCFNNIILYITYL